MAAERTLIKASHVAAYDGARHRHLRDGVVVFEGDTIVFVGRPPLARMAFLFVVGRLHS